MLGRATQWRAAPSSVAGELGRSSARHPTSEDSRPPPDRGTSLQRARARVQDGDILAQSYPGGITLTSSP